MIMTKVLRAWMGILFCFIHVLLGSELDCFELDPIGTQCSISVEKLLDRATQHAELIYHVSEEARTLFEQSFIPLFAFGDFPCTSNLMHIPTTKSEVQQISDEWLLHSVLNLIQSWIDPLADLQDSLDQYVNAPSSLLEKIMWISKKLVNLKHGVLILISKFLNEKSLQLENNESMANQVVPAGMVEHVLRDYAMLSCFKKDAHKIEMVLKLLNCRQTKKLNCYPF